MARPIGNNLETTGDVVSPKTFSGRGWPEKREQSEAAKLREENRQLKEENEILKKAAAYFARKLK